MKHFYINKNMQDNGDYEVHMDGCSHPPLEKNKISLGLHDNCQYAVLKAKTNYPQHSGKINGCYYCCYPCHTS